MVFYAWLLAEDEIGLIAASVNGGVGKKTHDPQRNGSLAGAPLLRITRNLAGLCPGQHSPTSPPIAKRLSN
jgi:hypothetical protein